MNDELDSLIERHLDGRATEEEIARLDRWLKEDPAARRALLLASDQEVSLRSHLVARAGVQSARLRGRPSPSVQAKGSWFWFAAAAALAGAAVLFATRFAPSEREMARRSLSIPQSPKQLEVPRPEPAPPLPNETPALIPQAAPSLPKESEPPVVAPPPPPPKAPSLPLKAVPEPPSETRMTVAAPQGPTIVRLEGSLEIRREGTWGALASAKPFLWREKEPVRGGTGGGRLTLGDGTRVCVDAQAELRAAGTDPPVLILEQGRMFFDVQPIEGRTTRLVVKTAEVEVRVTGTEFGVQQLEDRTEVVVERGRVEAVNPSGSSTLSAGTASTVRKGGGPSTPKPVDLSKLLAWQRDFDARAAGLPKGSRVFLREDFSSARASGWLGVAAEGALRSKPRTEAGEPFFSEARSPWDEPGIPSGRRTYLRFRYFAETFTPRHCFKLMMKRGDDNNFGGFLSGLTAGSWQTMTVLLADIPFINEPARLLDPGERIHQVVWLGYALDGPAPAEPSFVLDDVMIFEAPAELPALRLKAFPPK